MISICDHFENGVILEQIRLSREQLREHASSVGGDAV